MIGPFKKPGVALVVDDDPDLRSLIRFSLEPDGYQVVEAGDGFECLHQMIFRHPDVLVMDVVMPEMDGIELLQRIRRNPKFHALPVVAISGYGADDPRIHLIAAMPEVVLIRKPFVTMDLRIAIEKAKQLRQRSAEPATT